jgi:hypothetical protein
MPKWQHFWTGSSHSPVIYFCLYQDNFLILHITDLFSAPLTSV